MSNSDSARRDQTSPVADGILSPPHTVIGILQRLGPGMIIAGSIVGSGELIATTKTGAQAGFSLLWLILIGCVIKIFAQIEFGRLAVVNGQSSMAGMNELPGPRLRVNWLVWAWFIMFVTTIGQLGGIIGGVGQLMAMTFPITGDFNQRLDIQAEQQRYDRNEGVASVGVRPKLPLELQSTRDDVYWSVIVTAITVVLLVVGRYTLIQNVSTFLVASFTAVTLICLGIQQTSPNWAIRGHDILEGLSFHLPAGEKTKDALATALATFGIIGVGATELIAYPYWCLEKGYARFTGPRDPSTQWVQRARGWMRVMHWDACCCMVIYTLATLGFYLLGAGVLHREGLDPSNSQMLRTLTSMYRPTFGVWAEFVFLFGAFAVLYSTMFVASAGNARMATDALRVARLGAADDRAARWWVRTLSAVLPCMALGIYLWKKEPVTLVLMGGLAQALMLPMLGIAAMFFRYRRCDPRLAPSRLFDVFLWLSFAGLVVTGAWTAMVNGESLWLTIRSIFAG